MKKIICILLLLIVIISLVSCGSTEPTIQYIEKKVLVQQCCGNEGVEYAPIDGVNVAIICKACGRELGELPMATIDRVIEKEIIVEKEVKVSCSHEWVPCGQLLGTKYYDGLGYEEAIIDAQKCKKCSLISTYNNENICAHIYSKYKYGRTSSNNKYWEYTITQCSRCGDCKSYEITKEIIASYATLTSSDHCVLNIGQYYEYLAVGSLGLCVNPTSQARWYEGIEGYHWKVLVAIKNADDSIKIQPTNQQYLWGSVKSRGFICGTVEDVVVAPYYGHDCVFIIMSEDSTFYKWTDLP